MNGPFEQLKDRLAKFRLDPERKAAMRANLVHFIDAHEAVAVRAASVPAGVLFRRFAGVSLALLVVFAGGGASLAAEAALPGEPLYAIKTRVNEPVLAAFQTSVAAKAQWNARLAVRRLEEADQLALSGRLTAEAKTELETNFESSAKKAAATIASLNASGESEIASDVATNLESDLNAHAKILTDLDDKDKSDSASAEASLGIAADPAETLRITAAEPVAEGRAKEFRARTENSLVLKIHSALSEVKKARGEAEVKVAARPNAPDVSRAASAKINAAGRAIESVTALLNKNSGTLSADASAEAWGRLDSANALYAEANAKFEAQAYGEAFRLANKAERAAQEIRVLANAQLQAEAQAKASAAPAALTAPSALNFLTVENPQDSDGEDGIMVTAGGTTTSTLSPGGGDISPNSLQSNVDGRLEIKP